MDTSQCLLSAILVAFLMTVAATKPPHKAGGRGPAASSDNSNRRRNKENRQGNARLDLLGKRGLHKVNGVTKLQDSGLELHANFTGFRLPRSKTEPFLGKIFGDFSLTLRAHLLGNSAGSIVTVRLPQKKLPLADLSIDVARNTLTFRYLGVKSFQRVEVPGVFPDGEVSGSWGWSRLQVDVMDRDLLVHVDCRPGVKVKLRQRWAGVPEKARVLFGATPRRKKRESSAGGLEGIVFKAEMSVHGQTFVADCDPKADGDPFLADQPMGVDESFALQVPVSERVAFLEQQVAQLVSMVDMMKAQNLELTSRVSLLETCECRPSCQFNGTTYGEGMKWAPDMCTVCQCVRGLPSCRTRLDVPSCALPCMTNPCQHAGNCTDVMMVTPGININVNDMSSSVAGGRYQCQCPPPFTGPNCQVRQNPCIWPLAPGHCDLSLGRYYYDRFDQQCLPFNFTGCGGNVNNYEHIEQCVQVAMVGACCYRTFRTARQHIVDNEQDLQAHCRVMHVGECQMLHRPQGGLDHVENGVTPTNDTEVISFYPGLTCEEVGCVSGQKNCTVGQQSFSTGSSFTLGCQRCSCLEGGVLNCTCERVDVRRELRDMTREEIVRFQQAVAQLRLKGDDQVWEQLRDLHMTHRMHASGPPYFLPWHRYFLRQVELKLQEVDCSVVLPYLDFTTDVANFSQAAVWQANYFGGDGDGGEEGCVPDHPFGDPNAWDPCLSRRFNHSVALPTQVEIAMALASEDYMEMSMCLETVAAYLHSFIGGDMMTAGSPYDPAFLAVHAYIDMLYWTWQDKSHNKHQFPAAYGQIPLVPFNIPPWRVFDSEEALCVTYALPSTGHPCNVTDAPFPPTTTPTRPTRPRPSKPTGSGPKRGDIPISPEDGEDEEDVEVVGGGDTVELDLFGYSVDGFDRGGFDRFGFNRKGYNRDGFNREGYDVTGFDRYGFDPEGYSYDGFNRSGVDRAGNRDMSGRYDADGYDAFCFNRNGLNREGYDQYGYTVQGYDASQCNFHFSGPWAPRQSSRMLQVLGRQPKAFLMTLHRTCPGLHTVPDTWLQQSWITERKMIAGLVSQNLPSSFVSVPSQRFCFNTDTFLTACPCQQDIAVCQDNPCSGASSSCPAYPDAKCHIDFCGRCRAKWILDGKEVDCSAKRDFCQPNPCQHGGSCELSIWPTEPQLITCICPPGYDGHLCQYQVLDVCSLPLSSGTCEQQEIRWYYNYRSGSCEKFVYTGCLGNANNFPTADACEARCVVGACCYREPMSSQDTVGYDSEGFNKYGFNIEGVDHLNRQVTVNRGTATGSERFDQYGLDWQGFDRDGFNEQGLNRYGLDRQGYDLEGFNLTGYNQIGEYDGIIEYDRLGYDEDGYSRVGFNCHGYDRRGYDVYGILRGFRYMCRPLTRLRCQAFEARSRKNVEIVKFTPGKQCSEVECQEECRCFHGGQVYMKGEEFMSGCQKCTCMEGGHTVCVCDYAAKRREVRELSREEMQQYQRAVRQLTTKTGYPSRWFQLAELYSRHKPQAVGTPAFLPWHRAFLHEVERELQAVDCSIAIPYYDWTLDAGDPGRAVIWAADMFGGNGRWDGCVRYHPFKDYHPPLLSPCLRRRFNESVSLPDAVNVQLALNEPDYDRFRLHMEVFSVLLQSFVGGHMDSDLAPYDPVFFSVMAYIDKLWVDWQSKHQDGLLRYPPNLRFLPMEPFGATPDDVMDARLQLCTDYLPLLEGAPCNTTVVRGSMDYDEQGYDRHGYNRRGFDKDGFNIDGVDVRGNRDDRGIYNSFGFNRQGYSRSGYDQTGFDRFDFYIDTYNVDGFDPQGYDRSGYDRYGFDRQGFNPSGFHRNGSVRTDVVPRTSSSGNADAYDSYGYNIYGYNKFGFDREGYDVFGFDNRGFNRRVCNFYHLGPAYILVKKVAEEKLKTLGPDIIRNIPRVCPEVSGLPDYQLRNHWLYRNSQGDLVEVILTDQRRGHGHGMAPYPAPRNSSVLPSGLWLPVPPDARLCFLTHAFTRCGVDRPPVDCRQDLCMGLICPDHPTAVCRVNNCGQCRREWYDGVTGRIVNCTGCVDSEGRQRREGETWSDTPCSSCYCQEGMVTCREVLCDVPACRFPVQLPDQCCPSCQGCDYQGQVVPSGQPVGSARGDPCSRCVCQRGDVECRAVPCADLGGCRSPTVLEGDCCPVCLDCGQYGDGDVWSPSPCQRCTCQRGEVRCEKVQCPVVSCDHPYTPDGHCCPVCQECFYQGEVYQEGSEFRPDACSTCTCERGTVRCVTATCSTPRCDNPITPPMACCPACDLDCDYEGVRYPHSTDFTPSYNPCLNCTCNNSIVRCRPVHCPSTSALPCARPARAPGQCCPSQCPTCSYEGVEYDDGQTWQSPSAPCDVCECRGGMVDCRRQRSCPQQCSHGVTSHDECCPLCTDCLFEGRVIQEGRKVTIPGNPCRECLCRRGNLECQAQAPCQRLPCALSDLPPGHCCPVCVGCDYQGNQYRYGEVVSQTDCSRCVCDEGQIMCEDQREQCPPLPCQNPRQWAGQCCPVCEGCDYYARYYENGQSFVSPRDACERCTCERGKVSCTPLDQECPPLGCTHPARLREQCCPSCHDCLYQRRRVRNGQRFSPPDGGDPCTFCHCQDGSVTCERTQCPALRCSAPVTPPGGCCPECPMVCLHDGQQYNEGQRFNPPDDQCTSCVCQGGQVTCDPQSCPSTPCSHPATLPGECCPRCDFCLYEQRIFRSMQRFVHPHDSCQHCACQQGTVTCDPITCPVLSCSNPMPMAGQCCPVCPKLCVHDGLNYDDGENFTPPNSPCEECLCRQGRVQCKRSACPQTVCRHPRKEGCCPACNGCDYYGMTSPNGEHFPDPRNPCLTCLCQSGEVTCQPKSCPPVRCRDPAVRDCCPTCDDCDYQGTTFRNGDIFNDPHDECRQCQCVGGNVECQRKVCGEVTCLHPVQRGCCQDCNACMYRGRNYSLRQTFPDPDDPSSCGECVCEDGTVTCRRPDCPTVTCSNPTQGRCCPECRDCMYRGRTYSQRQSFPDPDDPSCGECICEDGTVTCRRPDCPMVLCSNPTQGRCCPECRDCQYRGGTIREGVQVPHESDPCQECVCQRGDISCFRTECPRVQCRNPVQRGCCSQCSECDYLGREYSDGESFSDPNNPCGVCRCSRGDVSCVKKPCEPPLCPHPVQGPCCPECSQCLFQGQRFPEGQRFSHPSEPCQSCLCQQGEVRCTQQECSPPCTHPVSLPGHCCPVCSDGCLYMGRHYQEGERYTQDCQECTCSQGSVSCQPVTCPPVRCAHPVMERGGGCCQQCDDCMYEGRVYFNGQSLPDRNDVCGECSCRDGTFSCEKKLCPAVTCANPAPGHCCLECVDCEMGGRVFQNGQRFPDPSDLCTQCHCEYGTVSCERAQCEEPQCSDPVKDRCGCGTCNDCTYLGQRYGNGYSFPHPSNTCQQCTCQSGSVTCRQKECGASCSHPVQVTGCCPLCTDCLYEGVVRPQAQAFTSQVDPCQECVCQAGNVQCSTITCPEVSCLNPIRPAQQCCQTCPVCQFMGQTFEDNSRFTHPNDDCQTCTCKEGRVECEKEECVVQCTHPRQDVCCPRCDMCSYDDRVYDNGQSFQPDDCKRCLCLDGNVVCEEEKCPPVNCLLTEQLPGQCCPQCKGCDYHERHYASNSSFLNPSNPCVSCVCLGGLVTCMEVECYVPCDNPQHVPGQCCPVCPSCSYNGIMYRDGEDFSPNGDICDSCHCGEGHLSCLHESCPSVANCPRESLVGPEPGQCCPTCAGLSTGCTLEDLGKITRPRPNDPCFYCECKDDFSWVCMKEQCPALDCPPDVQMAVPGQCCLTCPACYDRAEAVYHHEGETWTAVENPCISCVCQRGEISCVLQDCPVLSCGPEERQVQDEGQCCPYCQLAAHAKCFYQGRVMQPGQEWIVDECTRCDCRGGEVSCSIQHCAVQDCAINEIRATAPGQCCPVCLQRPGSCLVYGDPHYRTFDGATLHFQGLCRYVMASDCENSEFSVEVHHDSRGAVGEVSWAHNMTVTVGQLVVDLLQQGLVKVNGVVVDLPYLYEPHLYLELTGHTVLLTTNIGLQVSWNGDSQGEVMVPGSFKRRLCGLCGNFNGFPQDDLRTSYGQITNSPAVFGNSWKSTTQPGDECQEARDVDPCVSAGYRVRKIATTRCAIIKGKAFVRCHRVVSPEPFFSSCVYDMCVCMDDPNCLCNILASYAHECARAGVKLEWRSQRLCAFDCEEDKGFMFDECGPVCPRTCENLHSPLGNLTTHCFKPCVPSCQCTADKVVHEGRCIPPAQCPHILSHTQP